MSLAKDQLSALGLRVGQDITSKRLAELKDQSNLGKLRDRTLKWLGLRPRSAYELESYLRRLTDNSDHRDKLTAEMVDYGYIDDAKFAAAWIAGRTTIKPMSVYRLKQELIQKRVPKDIIADNLSEADIDELGAIKAIIAKRRHRYRDSRKLMAYLSRQGFRYGDIKQALSDTD